MLLRLRLRTLFGFPLLMMLLVCGCHTPPPDNPQAVRSEFRREHDPAFSPHERNLIQAARQRLEQTDKKPVDVFYRVRPKDHGYEVFVLYVTGYQEGKPIFQPCNDCAVLLGKDGSVREVLTGPAAWP